MPSSCSALREQLRFANSYTRMGAVVGLREHLPHSEWLRELGKHWSTCDNIRDYRMQLKLHMGVMGPLEELMTPQELERWHHLPDRLTIYRGCSRKHLVGAAWTLERAVANAFPFTNRYKVEHPVVVTATVRKSNVLAIKMDRDEEEIITFSAKRISIEDADKAAADQYHAELHKRNMARLDKIRARKTDTCAE